MIVTVPLGVLKQQYQSLFTPNLEQRKIDVIDRMQTGRISKIFLEWSRPWWLSQGINLVWSKEEMDSRVLPDDWFKFIFNFVPVEGQPKLLLFWVAGAASDVVDSLDDLKVLI